MADTLDESMPQESEETSPVSVASQDDSREVLFGGMVIVVFCILLLVLAGTFGYFGYRLWQSSQTERMTPSIQELGEVAVLPSPETPASEPASATPPASPASSTPESTLPDKATLEVKVMNGGGIKGSAGTLTDLLKKAGYTKATFGNTVADYTGQTIYYGADSLKSAEVLKEEVVKTYPKVTLAPAKAGDKDMTAATLVVILGK